MICDPLARWLAAWTGVVELMFANLVSRQVTRLRAGVLLCTLVAVPIVAALGTKPSEWFRSKPVAADTSNAHIANKPPEAQEQTSKKPDQQTRQDHATKSTTMVAEHVHDEPSVTDTLPTAATHQQDDNAVLRRWEQDETNPKAASGTETPGTSPLATAAPPSQFREVEQQLRQWGATYYLLEHWSNQGPLYRFHCRMSIDGLKHYNRHFEAVAEDPVAAMQDVLEQVRAWRGPLVVRPTT